MANINELVHRYMKSDNFWVSLSRDVLSAIAVIAVIGLALYAYAGVWPPLVSVDGTSMYPHMHDGDLILIQHVDYSKIMTYDMGKAAGYSTFGELRRCDRVSAVRAKGHDPRDPPGHVPGERVRPHVAGRRGRA